MYRYEARSVRNQEVRGDEESKLEPEIIMIKPIEGAGEKDVVGRVMRA